MKRWVAVKKSGPFDNPNPEKQRKTLKMKLASPSLVELLQTS
jgi:hypothetical protein